MNNARKDVHEGVRAGKVQKATPGDQLLRQLDERIIEARQALKDLRSARREIEEAHRNAVSAIEQATADAIKKVMPGYMESLRAAVDNAIEGATASVYKRFDTLADIMMGEEKPDDEPLRVLVRRWKARRD